MLIGHEVINIIIKKGIKSGKPLPEEWQKVILTIAGDPRVPKSSPSYRKWWDLIDKKYIEEFSSWLSRFDLSLFLKAVEIYSRESGNEDMKRMFPSRKLFLEGLHNKNLIGGSRLFVGSDMARYFTRNYDKDEIPKYTKLEEKDICIICLRVGELHMIEGSHNSYLWIFDKLPDGNKLFDYDKKHFRKHELGMGLKQRYMTKFRRKNADPPFNIMHHSASLLWQKKALSAFKKLGLKVKPEWVLSKSDYKEFRERFGLSL